MAVKCYDTLQIVCEIQATKCICVELFVFVI